MDSGGRAEGGVGGERERVARGLGFLPVGCIYTWGEVDMLEIDRLLPGRSNCLLAVDCNWNIRISNTTYPTNLVLSLN